MAAPVAASDAHPPVARVFVFDDRLGRGEGAEHEKLLGVFPSTTTRDECAAAVGLAQGITGFLVPFADAEADAPPPTPTVASGATEPSAEPSPRRVAEPRSLVLAADARRVACLECEPHIWWLLSVDARAAPERDVRDAALLETLADAHEDFVLVHGSVQSHLRSEPVNRSDRSGVDAARARLAVVVAALGVGATTRPTDETTKKRPTRAATTSWLTHALRTEPVALANPADPSAFARSDRRASEANGAEKGAGDDAASGARRAAAVGLDAVASVLARRGASVTASAAVYHAADGTVGRAAFASSRAIARFAVRCFAATEDPETRDEGFLDVRAEAASALAALRAFSEDGASSREGDDAEDASTPPESSRPPEWFPALGAREGRALAKDGRFARLDAARGSGVAAFVVRGDGEARDAATLACAFAVPVGSAATRDVANDVANDETLRPSREGGALRAALVGIRDAADAETSARARAVADGASQPRALVRLRGGGGGAAALGLAVDAKPLSRATVRAASATRADLDAARGDSDPDEFPDEACHRASHDAWVAVRGAAFLASPRNETPEGPKGSLVVSVAEGSGATLLEASARADACVRDAAR